MTDQATGSMRPQDFLTNPVPCSALQDALRKIRKHDNYPDQLRRGQDWSFLASKVVGAEY